MAQRSARETALAALRLWRKEKRFADSVISRLLAKTSLTPSDRAFALELFYGVLRNLTLLDFGLVVCALRASRATCRTFCGSACIKFSYSKRLSTQPYTRLLP